MRNQVLHGDCLDVLPDLPPGCADLLYCDPPFYSGRDYGSFSDLWPSLENYLAWMRPRLELLPPVLSPTGSLYLHCDPTASHYLKVMLDDIMGRSQFRNEIVWAYSGGGPATRSYPAKHDTLLFYTRPGNTFNPERIPYSEAHQRMFRHWDEHGRYRWIATPEGRRVKSYMRPGGAAINSVWTDIDIAPPAERTGYPTQKPLALLERIISASSNPGDLILDPMCGSGTTLVAARRLRRDYLGIDRNPDAVATAERRLADTAPNPEPLFPTTDTEDYQQGRMTI